MAFDVARGEAVLFGGIYNDIYYNKTYSYNLSNDKWTDHNPTISPPARAFASMTYDSINKVLVLFGGNATPSTEKENLTLFDDTWIYDMDSNTWTNMSPTVSPPARERFGMTFVAARGNTVLYGGITGKEYVMGADTWAYNLTKNTWTNMLPKNSPPPRCEHSMAYDPFNKKMVLVGGVSPSICNWRADSWNYNFSANDWTMGETVKMPRKLTSVVCPILFTDENINTAMLKRMAADQLDRKDSKVFTIPANMAPEKAFEVGKAAVQHHDVRLVRELSQDRPQMAEAWYYGKAKGRPEKLVVRVRVIPEMSFLEFSVSTDSVLMLTGMLAELKSDLNKELESHKLKGAMRQVTDREDIDAVAEIRAMLEKAGEPEKEAR